MSFPTPPPEDENNPFAPPPPGATPPPPGGATPPPPPPPPPAYGEPVAPGTPDYGTPPPPPPPPPPAYGAPAYGTPAPYGTPAYGAKPENGTGVAALVLGIISLVCCYVGIIPAVIAIVLGRKGMALADEGRATNRGVAQAGFVLGVIGAVLGGLLILLWIFTLASGRGSSTIQP